MNVIFGFFVLTITSPLIIVADKKLEKDEASNSDEIRIYKRLIPADVLRG